MYPKAPDDFAAARKAMSRAGHHSALLPAFAALHVILSAVVLAAAAAVTPDEVYVPEENYLINCGSSGKDTDLDNREWLCEKDLNITDEGLSHTLVGRAGRSSAPAVPYLSARISTKQFTYSFRLSRGRKFLRLYFKPSDYTSPGDTFAASDARFDVTTAEHILLKNFSAAETALALNYDYIELEYSLNFSSSTGFVNVSFTPSTEKANSYAFVNGIEIVSIPDVFPSRPLLVGANVPYTIGPNNGLQTVARLNVGGNYISPMNDSGLYRRWYDDSAYVYGAGFGVSYAKNRNVTVKYTTADPMYIAPADVYGTARSMGPTVSVNRNYNLTWIVTVDANFYYLVRLHFCEIQYPMTKQNMRVFDVFVDNHTATSMMDVISRSKRIGVPIHMDYVVVVPAGPTAHDLWIALHPNEGSGSEYVDAILNGLEVFKLSGPDGNLAGPNPTPRSIYTGVHRPFDGDKKKKNTNVAAIIGGAIGGAIAFLLLCLTSFLIYRRSRPTPSTDPLLGGGNRGLPTASSHRVSKPSTSGPSTDSFVSSNLCRHFSFAEIEAATEGFNENLLLGVGGFGKVYRGSVVDGCKMTTVAIKRANPSSDQGVHEFLNEIEMLSQLRHRHLVSLIGSCEENGEMILVYDFMANGTLREHLYSTKKQRKPLSWLQRLEICIGAARGLHYLHTGAKYTIIHRDVKTTNILLDDMWVAKVSDFGLSKAGPAMDATHVSTIVKGSFGYMDPEYFKRQQLTDKSDVYSFGVVLFEVLCGRPALLPPNPNLSREEISLAEWALHCKKQGVIDDIVDRNISGKIDPKCLSKYAEVAEKCLAEHGVDRPTMGDVLWTLETVLQLQRKSDAIDGTTDDYGDLTAVKPNKDVDDHDHDHTALIDSKSSTTATTSTTTTTTTTAVSTDDSRDENTPSVVFSEIVRTEGR